MKWVRQKFLDYHLENLIDIQVFTYYDDLQEFEADVFYAMGKYQNFMEEEILNRNKLVAAIHKQVEIKH